MEDCLGVMNLKIFVIYLDDLIIYSKTFEKHLDRLEQVISRLKV